MYIGGRGDLVLEIASSDGRRTRNDVVLIYDF